ncbi:MAG: RsmF rRNA methyltransferase first C-terminal domain-containing protein [Gorillibacterium sp.]|nr:RsmF rRNA methyltransferase first C-terminal domain-containing protein [Gorillibacterium sp.]
MTQLPDAFISRMRIQLGAEADSFFASFEEKRTLGIRRNPLKIDELSPLWTSLHTDYGLEPVPWCPTGFYYQGEARPGKSPYHAAGLYYIQEPSAMSAVELLNPLPGDIVLDLAAAPGGKSTQIAGKLQGKGLLIANETHAGRAKILSENIERLGVRNAVVTQMKPDNLAKKFPLFFDKIMLDAPCSGEGMFRKDPAAVEEWKGDMPTFCSARQAEILDQAAPMLKPGGTLGYSTCTFNQEENEDTVEAFLKRNPEFEWVQAERIWPHIERGEGHFVAILRKRFVEEVTDTITVRATPLSTPRKRDLGKSNAEIAWEQFLAFSKIELPGFKPGLGEPILFGEHLYWLPHSAGSSFSSSHLEGVRTFRPGLHVAELKKNRIEPTHALALALHDSEVRQSIDLEARPTEVTAYLRGDTLEIQPHYSGWCLVTLSGHPLGFGKASEGQLKNHYPKGLRKSF